MGGRRSKRETDSGGHRVPALSRGVKVAMLLDVGSSPTGDSPRVHGGGGEGGVKAGGEKKIVPTARTTLAGQARSGGRSRLSGDGTKKISHVEKKVWCSPVELKEGGGGRGKGRSKQGERGPEHNLRLES